MKMNQTFVILALAIIGIFFSVMSFFKLSLVEWFISDIILGGILYFSYLVIASIWADSRRSDNSFFNKATAQK